MKHSIWHLAMYTIALAVAFVMLLHVTSCDGRTDKSDGVEMDSTIIVNPQFDNVSAVLTYKDELSTSEYEDSVFRQMSPTMVFNIATVVINRDGFATKTSIVKEYEHGKQIYDGLPQNIPDSLTHPKQISSEISSKDTVINGKKVRIKTIKEYE